MENRHKLLKKKLNKIVIAKVIKIRIGQNTKVTLFVYFLNIFL